MMYQTSSIRRIGLIGYGVLGYSGMVFCTSWVRRIKLLRQWSFDSSKSWKRRIGNYLQEEAYQAKKDVPSKKKPASKPKPTKKKAHVKADRGKGLNVLSEVALSEAAQLKEATKQSKKDFHISQASGSGDGTDFQSGVPDEQHHKTSGADEGTGTKLGVPNIPKYDFESDKESWGDSEEEDDDDEDDTEDDNGNDASDGNDDYDDDDDDDNDNDGDDNDANDDDNQEDDDKNDDVEEIASDRTESDRIKIPILNQSNTEYYEEEEEEEEEKINDEEKMDEEEDDEVTKELYKDVNVNLGNEDVEMTNADQGRAYQQNVSQESVYEKVEEDAHVTLTMVHDTQKTNGTMQSSSVSFDFTSKLLNLKNPSIADNEIASLMDAIVCHEEPRSQTSPLYTVPITAVPEITSFYRYINNKLGDAIQKVIQAYNLDCREEAQAEKRDYIELVDTSMRAILKEEVNTQLPQILPQAVLDFATPVIDKNVIESLEFVVLARSSSQPKSTYEVATSLFEFDLTKILIYKMEKNKSYDKADYKRELYDALVKSYQTDKDLFDTYGEVFTLKRSRYDKDKDQDPSAGSDRGTKRRKSSKEAESSRDSRSKEKKSSSTSKDASHSQHKPSGKSAHAEDPSYTVNDSRVQQNQEFDTGNNDEQLADKEVSKADCYTELEYHLEECSKATTERLDWHKPEGRPYPFDLSKPLPLIPDHRGHQSPVKVIYDKHAYWGTSHWGPKRQHFYRFAANMSSSKDVYSRKRIITVTRLTIMKKYDYGHLEEIEVRWEDQKLYTFREGDFP
ncbi:hypothetical protein Tco_1275935 [Tanacetum coccineum]